MPIPSPTKKLTIIGGGMIGLMEAYFAYLDAKEKNETIRVTIYEKNEKLSDTTIMNIVPSLTPDEIVSVIPRGENLLRALAKRFSDGDGIRVDDVKDVADSESARAFIEFALRYSQDEQGHIDRTNSLFKLGAMSMKLWTWIYDTADDELKRILEESNFKPCHERTKEHKVLGDGYRIDLIYDVPDARQRANGMRESYVNIGYTQCTILSPEEVEAIDPSLSEFCKSHSEQDAKTQKKVWKNTAVALWRPGGCLDATVFFPRFIQYLTNVMGTYESEESKESATEVKEKPCFRYKLSREVSRVQFSENNATVRVEGLGFTHTETTKTNKKPYNSSDYVFCPGEAVGTLRKLGFSEPAYARFAGPSLLLSIPIPEARRVEFESLNHCMEVHQEGVVLAWQARMKDENIFIGVGGTKAFYGETSPNVNDDFAVERNLLQLSMIKDVLPKEIALALGRELVDDEKLTLADLQSLEEKGIAVRWVGSRSVVYDGYPTLNRLSDRHHTPVSNARCTTHLGSGGGSFAPAAVRISRSAFFRAEHLTQEEALINQVIDYSSCTR